MTDADTELADAFEEARAAARRVHEAADGDSIPEEEADELRETAARVASLVSESSPTELLEAAGVEDAPADASPVDLPEAIRDADPAAVVDVRTLLRVADLGESWADLAADERRDRVARIVDDEGGDADGIAKLQEFFDSLAGGHSDDDAGADGGEAGADGEATEADDADDSGGEHDSDDADGSDDSDDADDADDSDGDDSAEDDELLQLADHLDRVRALLSEGSTDDGDGGSDEEADEKEVDEADETGDDRTDGRPASTAGSGRFSTVPAARSDVGSSSRFSTIRGRK